LQTNGVFSRKQNAVFETDTDCEIFSCQDFSKFCPSSAKDSHGELLTPRPLPPPCVDP